MLADDLSVRFLNPAAESLFGVSLRQVEGVSLEHLLPGADDFITAIKRGFDEQHAYTERELELITPPIGRRYKVDCTVTPISDAGESVILVEIRTIDRLLRIAREEHFLAQQKATKVLLRGLAHEVKNPLGGLRGAAQLLERELPDAALKEYTQVIIGEADRLQSLVDHMLGPNRLPNKSRVNIHEVLERVRQLILAEAGEGLVIERDYDPSLPEITADRDQLIQAVLNIVQNAKQALGGRGKITLRSRSQRQFTIGKDRFRLVLRIDIIDNGPGIAPEIMPNIFFPMVTGRAEGTGLGLPIAQSIIAQHGGVIECSSVPGETVFTLILPLLGEDEGSQLEGNYG